MNYRIIVRYSEEKQLFVARVPEMEDCSREAETRGEALSLVEEALAARLEEMRDQGEEPPVPVDLQELASELQLKVSPTLYRDLLFAAREAGVELDVFLTEVLTRSVTRRVRGHRQQQQHRHEGRGRGREGQGQRYHDIMENRADFIEYVRKLDNPGGARGRGPHRGRKGRPKNRD